MPKVVSFASHKFRKAADRGFGEWQRRFSSITFFDEHTRWTDLPDEVILFFCEETPASKHSLYGLIMNAQQLGSAHDFETQPFDRLSTLLNVYFFITDQVRFECMRRLGWVEVVPKGDQPIIEVAMTAATYDYASLLETPAPTPVHPCHAEDVRSNGMDRAALVRRYAPRAVEQFSAKTSEKKSSELQRKQ